MLKASELLELFYKNEGKVIYQPPRILPRKRKVITQKKLFKIEMRRLGGGSRFFKEIEEMDSHFWSI